MRTVSNRMKRFRINRNRALVVKACTQNESDIMDKQNQVLRVEEQALVVPLSTMTVHAFAERVESDVDIQMDETRSKVPLVQAELLSSVESCSSEGSVSDESIASACVAHESVQFAYERPKFLYVMAQKAPTQNAGLVFRKDQQGVYIHRIRSDSLFAHTALQQGDRLIAINGVACACSSLKYVATLIGRARSHLSICADNPSGNASTFLSSIQKNALGEKVGVSFQRSRGALIIPRVSPAGLFGRSLLVPGHRCLVINGECCEGLDAKLAANITRESYRVTIISQPRNDMAAVLAGFDDSGIS